MTKQRKREGTFLGMPFDWRKPTRERFKRSMWNKQDDRLLRPKAYGWGYDLNLAALTKRLSRRTRA